MFYSSEVFRRIHLYILAGTRHRGRRGDIRERRLPANRSVDAETLPPVSPSLIRSPIDPYACWSAADSRRELTEIRQAGAAGDSDESMGVGSVEV